MELARHPHRTRRPLRPPRPPVDRRTRIPTPRPRGAELLFQAITEREERAGIAFGTNAPFSEWANTFADPRLCAAIIDRLTFNATSSKPAPTPTDCEVDTVNQWAVGALAREDHSHRSRV